MHAFPSREKLLDSTIRKDFMDDTLDHDTNMATTDPGSWEWNGVNCVNCVVTPFTQLEKKILWPDYYLLNDFNV